MRNFEKTSCICESLMKIQFGQKKDRNGFLLLILCGILPAALPVQQEMQKQLYTRP